MWLMVVRVFHLSCNTIKTISYKLPCAGVQPAVSLSPSVQQYNRSSVTAACRSVPSKLPFFFSSSQQEVYCWVQSEETTAAVSLWSSSESARLVVSSFCILSQSRSVSVLLRAAMNTLKQPHSDATSSGWSLMSHKELTPQGADQSEQSHLPRYHWLSHRESKMSNYMETGFFGDFFLFRASNELFGPNNSKN